MLIGGAKYDEAATEAILLCNLAGQMRKELEREDQDSRAREAP